MHFAWLLFLSLPAHAFRLDPMVLEVPLTSPQASATYTVQNNTREKIAAQFEVRKRVIGINGVEERPEAEGFLVYPAQLALEPGEKRSVRATWTGDAIPPKEVAYRFVATQLPVDFQASSKAGVKLKFLVEYVAALYLVPPKAKPKMKVVKSSVTNKGAEILVANEGTAHFLLDRAELSFRAGSREIKADPEAVKNIRAENILAGSERLLKLPLPNGAKAAGLAVEIKFEP